MVKRRFCSAKKEIKYHLKEKDDITCKDKDESYAEVKMIKSAITFRENTIFMIKASQHDQNGIWSQESTLG